MELTGKQWSRIEPVILQSAPKKDSRGRKCRDPREVLNGILWILRTGAPWKDLPDRHPPCQTCYRRFQAWSRCGVFRLIIEELAADLQERGGLDLREAAVSFRLKTGQRELMAIADAAGLPVLRALRSMR